MAHAGSQRLDLDENGVDVAVGRDFFDHQAMAGAFALEPQLVSRPAIESCKAGLHRLPEGLFVHEADHEDATGLVILNHRRQQAIEFLEIQLHSLYQKCLKLQKESPPGFNLRALKTNKNRFVIKSEPVAAWDARGDDGVRENRAERRT